MSLAGKILLILCVLLQCVISRADRVSDFNEHSARAKQHYLAGRYREASDEFLIAHSSIGDPLLLINVGVCALALKEPERALALVLQVRQIVPAPTPEVEKTLQSLERRARAKIPRPVPPPPPPPIPIPGRRASRPLWRILSGALAVTGGLALTGLGVTGLVLNGRCSNTACDHAYDSLASGAALTAIGGGITLGGVALLAWPGAQLQPQVTLGGAAMHLSLSF